MNAINEQEMQEQAAAMAGHVSREFTADNVEQAVLRLYRGGCPQDIQQWLTRAQHSRHAWSFSFQLLQAGKSEEVQFFGARCLHIKVTQHWCQLQREQRCDFRDQVMSHLTSFVHGPRLVTTRLCSVVACLVLRLMYDLWKTAIDDIISLFQQDATNVLNTDRCQLVLDILTEMPDECQRLTARGGCVASYQDLEAAMPKVLTLLHNLLHTHLPSHLLQRVLRCVGTWSHLDFHPQPMEAILDRVVSALDHGDDGVFDVAVEAAVAMLTHPFMYKYKTSVEKQIAAVSKIQEVFNKACQSHEKERLQGLCHVAVTAAERHSTTVLSLIAGGGDSRELAQTFLRTVMTVVFPPGHYLVEETCSDMSLAFWDQLQDEMFDLDSDDLPQVLPVIKQVYTALTQVLLHKVQYPSEEHFLAWNKEDQEKFAEFRESVGETMMNCLHVLGDPLLEFLYTSLQAMMDSSHTQCVPWQTVEAALFLFASLGECREVEDSGYLPQVMHLLPAIQRLNDVAMSTALSFIGHFGQWMGGQPEALQHALPLLLEGLSHTKVKVTSAAIASLKGIAMANLSPNPRLHPFIPDILHTCQDVLQRDSLPTEEASELVTSLGYLLSSQPSPTILHHLHAVVGPPMERLHQLLQQEVRPEAEDQLVKLIRLLACLFNPLNIDPIAEGAGDSCTAHSEQAMDAAASPHPLLVVMQQLVPVLQQVISQWKGQPGVVEAVCHLLKKCLLSLRSEFHPLADAMATMMMDMYQATPLATILDLARQIVLAVQRENSMEQYVVAVISSMTNATLQDFDQGKQDPDVIEGFMIFMTTMVKKRRALLLRANINLETVLKAGLWSVGMAEPGVMKAGCLLLMELLAAGAEEEAIQRVVHSNMAVLVDAAMRAIGGECYSHTLYCLSDVLHACCKHHLPVASTALHASLSARSFPTPLATAQDKACFLKLLLRANNSLRSVREAVKDSAAACQGTVRGRRMSAFWEF